MTVLKFALGSYGGDMPAQVSNQLEGPTGVGNFGYARARLPSAFLDAVHGHGVVKNPGSSDFLCGPHVAGAPRVHSAFKEGQDFLGQGQQVQTSAKRNRLASAFGEEKDVDKKGDSEKEEEKK
eukprot:CAMPEP_0197704032 /NCGR_PEP_ID=MMETSP1338-20131121/125735_1 /TAXON_ID=43686 ORGANISM="Pelagodinium beii, Strain RCC1491" /NCGR_SAMPLE_ID=MMETSP1338 /ASSEMBLY_ACC=CAM_ASM_000754 /LENGTH=122 /DNA_ID=CAMNT_0043287931 /DNA_START=58 /DNA_END=426 /DNA_ORIENTATION=-